jgi:hypothetical protein
MYNISQNNDTIDIDYHKSSEELNPSSNNNVQKNVLADLHLPQKLNENNIATELFPNQATITDSVPTKKRCISRARKYYFIIISVVCFIMFFLVLFLIP